MKYLFIAVLLCTAASLHSQTFVGIVETKKDKKPIANCKVTNTNTNAFVITGGDGKFSIDVGLGNTLVFTANGYKLVEYLIEESDYDVNGKLKARSIPMDVSERKAEPPVNYTEKTKVNPRTGRAAISPKSFWLGATVGYNLGGNSIEDLVGSAKIMINPLSKKFMGGDGGIIGNFSNFLSTQNKEDAEKDLRKVLQSTQGLMLGLANTWTLKEGDDKSTRSFATLGARQNSFKNVGEDSSEVNLFQARATVGLEFEGFSFGNGGMLNLSAEASLSLFDQDRYAKVFNEKKNALISLETTIILPLSKNIGFLVSPIFSERMKPVYQIGIIFKDLAKKETETENTTDGK